MIPGNRDSYELRVRGPPSGKFVTVPIFSSGKFVTAPIFRRRQSKHAKGSKAARAEPVALRFETGRAKLAGAFPDLEDELCALAYAGFEGPSNSPDRADAMVWAMSDLFETRAEPRIRRL